MIKLLDDIDTRNVECGVRLIDRDLFRGVGRNRKGDSTIQDEKSSSNNSSSLVDSHRLDHGIAQKVSNSEIEASVIIEAERTPSQSISQSSYKTNSRVMSEQSSSAINKTYSSSDESKSRSEFS